MKLLTRLFMGTVLLLAACAVPSQSSDLDPSMTVISEKLSTTNTTELLFLNLKINPDIELIVGPNDEVIAVVNKNEDAEILVADLNLIGMKVSDAVALIVEEAIASGYLVEDATDLVEIEYAVTGENETEIEDLEDEVETAIKAEIDQMAIYAIALNRKVIDDTLIEAAKVNDLTVDEYLLKVLGDTIGYVYDDNKNYGQNVSALVHLLNDIRQTKNETEARIRANQRIKEKLQLMLEVNQRHMAHDATMAQTSINKINEFLDADMSALSETQRSELRLQLETMLQAELTLRQQAQLAINQAQEAIDNANTDNPDVNLTEAETSTAAAITAMHQAFTRRYQLKISNQEAEIITIQAKAKINGANPGGPGGPNG